MQVVINDRIEICFQTRVLVTHQVRFLPQVDHIIVLRNGVITEVL